MKLTPPGTWLTNLKKKNPFTKFCLQQLCFKFKKKKKGKKISYTYFNSGHHAISTVALLSATIKKKCYILRKCSTYPTDILEMEVLIN